MTETGQYRIASKRSRAARIATTTLSLGALAGLIAFGVWNRQSPQGVVPVGGTATAAPAQAAAFDPRSAVRLVATVRWGHPESKPEDIAAAGQSIMWDGYLSLNCGAIEQVEPLGLELERAPDGRLSAADRMGPVVVGEGGDQRVYWRSLTRSDWDGVRVQLAACPRSQGGGTPTQLRIVTPPRTYVARLDWTVDDFVSLPVGMGGASLDVHITAANPAEELQRTRVTHGPAPKAVAEDPVADAPETDVDALPKVTPPAL